MMTGAKSAIVSFSAAKIHLFCEKAILKVGDELKDNVGALSQDDSARRRLFGGTTKFWVAIRGDFQQLAI